MSSKRIVVANWKMHPKTIAEAKRLFLSVKKVASKVRGVQIVICPPTPFLTELRKLYIGKRMAFGAQDTYSEKSGSYTGYTSPTMLKSVGASYVIVGHSERRARGETNDDVQKKVRAALNEKFTVILCVGEEMRDSHGEYLHFIKEEVTSALKGVAKDELKRIIVAYEPIWAIGKSHERAMKPHDLHQMSLFIRKVLTELFTREYAMGVPVIYGGSVEPENALPLMEEGDINGFLLGHASLDATDFGNILENVHSAR